MCITVFDIVLEGWNLDTKDLTVNTDESQLRGTRSLMCSFGGENPEEREGGKRLPYRHVKKEKEKGEKWPLLGSCDPPPGISTPTLIKFKGQETPHWMDRAHLEALH